MTKSIYFMRNFVYFMKKYVYFGGKVCIFYGKTIYFMEKFANYFVVTSGGVVNPSSGGSNG